MRSKWYLLLVMGIAILLISSVVGCGLTGTQGNELDDYLNYGYAHTEEGKYEEAINDFTQALELDPDSAEALVARAIANVWAGYYEQAEDDFNTAVDMSFGSFTLITADAYIAWGIALTAQYSSYSRLDEAKYLFDSAISQDANNPDAYTGRALMHLKVAYSEGVDYESTGYYHLRQAISDFEKAIKLDHEGIQGRIKRLNLEGEMAFLPNYIAAYCWEANLLVSAYQDYSRALEAYSKVLEVCPDDVEALIGRGTAYIRLQQYDLALYDFNKANELAPNNPHVYAGCTSADQLPFIQGNLYLEQQEWSKAIADYTEAIELNPEFAEAYANRAVARLRQLEYDLGTGHESNYNRAIADCEKAIELNPMVKLKITLAEAYVRRGYYYFSHQKYDEAIADYTMAIELDPQVIECQRLLDIYWQVGLDHLDMNDYDKAIAYYTKAIELDCGNSEYFYGQLAEAYYGRGFQNFKYWEPDKAITDFSKAIELDPDEAKYYYYRGETYYQLADYYWDAGQVSKEADSNNKAIADYTRAIELGIESSTIYNYRGNCYGAIGDYNRAIDDYTRAIELGTEMIDIIYGNRGNAYANMGNKNEALDDYRQALALSEDDWYKEQISKYIEELQ